MHCCYWNWQTEGQEVDISTKMRKRVKQGYGFDVGFLQFSILSNSIPHSPFQPYENAKLLSDDTLLTQVWQWLKCEHLHYIMRVLDVHVQCIWVHIKVLFIFDQYTVS